MIKRFIWSMLKNPRVRLGLVALSLLLILLPGQNVFQTLTLKISESKIRQASVNLTEPADYPVAGEEISDPYLTARGAIIIDIGSGAILYEKNPDVKLLPASTTKIMTALVAMDVFGLEEVVTVSNESQSIGHVSELVSGEKLTVEDLLYAMLVSSGNDAALALGQHYSEGYQAFVSLMNQKAEDLNLVNTSYRNVSGLEQNGHYTSVRDLALLTKEAMKNQLFRKIVKTEEITIESVDGKYKHNLNNINELLGEVEGIRGVKTGWTTNAGECLVTSTLRDGKEIVVVVLGSDDRFGESEAMIEWAYRNYTWQQV